VKPNSQVAAKKALRGRVRTELLWLMDAAYDNGEVKLTFVQSPTGTLTVTHESYEPYMYALPVSAGEQASRQELLSGEWLKVAKVPRTSPGPFSRVWERDVDPALSHVYDKQLHFGTPYRPTSTGMDPTHEVTEAQETAFQSRYGDLETEDPLKYELLREFFERVLQPAPPIPLKALRLDPELTEAQLFRAMTLARIANMPLRLAVSSHKVSEFIRSMLQSTYRHLDVLMPDPEELKKGQKPHTVEGALVIAPTPGAYHNMTVMDFESLYPSCIDRYNLSYETVDCGHPECQKNTVPGTTHQVCTKRRGIYSALLGALKDLRIGWFKPLSRQKDLPEAERSRAKTVSDLIKYLLVSSGGVTIRIRGLACPPFAESMMAYGRWALRSSWDAAIEHGMHPVYGDTDSLFLDNPSRGEVEWLTAETRDELGLTLAVDAVYPLCVFSSAKKAYFGILPDGKVDAKGITLGKSSTPPLFRAIFLDVLKPLAGVDGAAKLAKASELVVQRLRERVASLRRGEFTVPDMEIRVKVWKAMERREKGGAFPQPYQALQQLADRGIKVKRWEEVGFVKVKPFRYGKRTFTVKPTRMAAKEDIDIPDYVRRLQLAFQQVLQPLNILFPSEETLGLDVFLPAPSEVSEADREPIRKPSEGDESPRKQPQKRLTDYD
jgi:DNA polymerase elongation subunit (family B)